MQTVNIWHKFNLHWRKITLTFSLLCLCMLSGLAQDRYNPINPSGQDDQFLSYGFFLAAHTTSLRLKYSDAFMDPENPAYANIRSIQPVFSPGFSLGFLLKMRLHDQLTFMATPKVGFYEFRTDVSYFAEEAGLAGDIIIPGDGEPYTETVITEMTMVEMPLLFKYKSMRFDNSRMFFVAGANPMFRTKSQDEADADQLVLKSKDVALELGVGFDFYFKFFKFSPEIRFSHGLNNIYKSETSDQTFAGAISELRRKSITLYLNFQ
ncbi:PorT family protein [Echinicola strongylocentroti]|uniref:PorT family protein n=1 Tax=Echinicola strongylocentroti TaxID=1795355 RepID=A0A2Z4IJM5_9BACT|nr:porin family protein [Echinicola strongylocentroti]AWW31342.1 PorT family protein [Echinicola strongylocentroti]